MTDVRWVAFKVLDDGHRQRRSTVRAPDHATALRIAKRHGDDTQVESEAVWQAKASADRRETERRERIELERAQARAERKAVRPHFNGKARRAS